MLKLESCSFPHDGVAVPLPPRIRHEGRVCFVECLCCGATGPRAQTEVEAAISWSSRVERVCTMEPFDHDLRLCSACGRIADAWIQAAFCHGCGARIESYVNKGPLQEDDDASSGRSYGCKKCGSMNLIFRSNSSGYSCGCGYRHNVSQEGSP